METYEEVVRRNEPKNYTVRWQMADGTQKSDTYFESFEEARFFSEALLAVEGVENIQILRSGRHPNAKRWLSAKRSSRTVQRRSDGLFVNEDAWAVPAGYVDGDADKHGPAVVPAFTNRMPARSNAEKAEWARNNSQDTGLLGFRAI